MADLTSALSRYFDSFEEIREELARALDGWDTPVIVVFGPENAGKSTLLERLVMLSLFPKGDGLCTRVPIRIRLRTGDSAPPKMSIISVSGGEESIVDEALISGDVSYEVSEKMNRLITELDENERGIRTDRIIQVELWAESYPNIDLLDLPGMVVNAGPNDAPDLPDQTYQLVLDTIDQTQGRAIYLAVREAGEQARQSLTIKVLTERPDIKDSCLGVLTKCDYYRDNMIMRELKASAEWELGYGYVATMNAPLDNDHTDFEMIAESQGNLFPQTDMRLTHNAPLKNSHVDFEMIAEAEREWFSQTEARQALLDNHSAGCDELITKLGVVYRNYLQDSWVPHTMKKLALSAGFKRIEIRELGVPILDTKPSTAQLAELQKAIEFVMAEVSAELSVRCETEMMGVEIYDQSTGTFLGLKGQYGNHFDRDYFGFWVEKSALLKSAFHPKRGFTTQLSSRFEPALSALALDARQRLDEALRDDRADSHPKTSARLSRFPNLITQVLKLISVDVIAEQLKAALCHEAERFFTANLHYEGNQGHILRLDFLQSRLVSAVLVALTKIIPELNLKSLLKKYPELFEDHSADERASLNSDIAIIRRAQERLAELFELDATPPALEIKDLHFDHLWDKNGLIWHLAGSGDQIDEERARSLFEVETSSWASGDPFQIICGRKYMGNYSSDTSGAYFQVKLRTNGVFQLSSYTLRSGWHYSVLRSWRLLGITATGDQILIDEREGDISLQASDSSAHWEVPSHSLRLSGIRLEVTRSEDTSSNYYSRLYSTLPISGIELYGYYLGPTSS